MEEERGRRGVERGGVVCSNTEKEGKEVSSKRAVTASQFTSRKSPPLLQKVCDPVLPVDPVIQSEANTTP